MAEKTAIKRQYSLVARHVSTASTNAVVLVDGPAVLVGYGVITGATARWLRFYDLNRAPLPSDTPIFVVRTNASLPLNSTIPNIYCVNGIAIRITANGAPPTYNDSDDTAITANDVYLNVYYQRPLP